MSDELTEKIIGAAIEVHRIMGPGLLESIYEEALCHEIQCKRPREPLLTGELGWRVSFSCLEIPNGSTA
jgi:hypothetical protein